MAPGIPPECKLPKLGVEAPVREKGIPSSFPVALGHPEIPRLFRFKGASGSCSSCDVSGATTRCDKCGGMVLYCGARIDCYTRLFLDKNDKDVCNSSNAECPYVRVQLKEEIKQKSKEMEGTDLIHVSEIITKVFKPDYIFPGYKCDPKLEVPIKDNVSFGSLQDVLGQSDLTTREFQSGLYKCTSVTPYEYCEPLIIYHHESVDPCKIVKQCILMSRDFNDHSKEVNQITEPDWCICDNSDDEYNPYKTEYDASVSEDDDQLTETETLSDYSENEREVLYAESTSILDERKDSLSVVTEKNKFTSVEDCESGDDIQDSSENETSSDEKLYAKFVVKLVNDNSDDEFMPPDYHQDSQTSDCSEEKMSISDAEIQMVKDDFELSRKEKLYKTLKSAVIKSRKRKRKGTENPAIKDNQNLIYFMNSCNSSDLKNLLDNGKFEKAEVIPESFTIDSEPIGMAVAVRSIDWRSAYVLEDSSSKKAFALVVATDMGPLSNFSEEWESLFPDLPWTSVSETQLLFNINDFLIED